MKQFNVVEAVATVLYPLFLPAIAIGKAEQEMDVIFKRAGQILENGAYAYKTRLPDKVQEAVALIIAAFLEDCGQYPTIVLNEAKDMMREWKNRYDREVWLRHVDLCRSQGRAFGSYGYGGRMPVSR